jgi:hypothetical protein
MTPSPDVIHMIDEIELHPGMNPDEFIAAFRARYLPGAQERGMELVHVWITPPEYPPEMGATAILVWALDGVAGFWRMRSQNAAPEVAAWWKECAKYCVRRTRRFAVAPEARAEMKAAGRAHA